MEMIKRLMKEEEGQGMVEYALIIALVAVFLIVILTTMRDSISSVFGKASDELDKVD